MAKQCRTRITIRRRDWLVFRFGVMTTGEDAEVLVCPNCQTPIADIVSDSERSEESFDERETSELLSPRYQLPGKTQ